MRKITKKQILPGALCLAALLVTAALLLPREQLPGWEETELLTASQQRRILRELTQAVEACQDVYAGAEKLPREYSGGDPLLGQQDRDAMEARLMEAGFATVDTDAVYPAFLVNPEGVYAFSQGEQDTLSILQVGENGALWHTYFSRGGEEDCAVVTEVMWDEKGACIRERNILPLYEAELTPWGIFYYRLYPAGDPHYADYSQVRLTPVDRELHDLFRKYIYPVSYQMVNLFLCDWQEGNWGTLSFPDLLESLYQMENGAGLPWEQYMGDGVPLRAWIPAELFEETILPYFDISREALRALCQYDEERNAYAWRPVYGDDLTSWHYPYFEPQVTAAKENADGTLTLTVQVYSADLKTDRLFIHKVTVRPLEGERFQYVGNRVTYVSEQGLPPAMPRFALDGGIT